MSVPASQQTRRRPFAEAGACWKTGHSSQSVRDREREETSANELARVIAVGLLVWGPR